MTTGTTKSVLTIIGARPQFIKAAPLSRALRKQRGLREILVHTGQHYDKNMSDVFFKEMAIPKPDYMLAVGSGTHAEQTGEIMKRLEPVLIKEKPSLLLIYGDTNSTLAGALTAAKLHIPIAHVEAGLRSFNMRMPEEINRIVADRLSTLLFVPTYSAIKNLKIEGITKNVFKTGDVMYDAALFFGKAAEKSAILKRLCLVSKKYALATIHRAENTDDKRKMAAILGALARISATMKVVLPLHPRTRKMVAQFGLEAKLAPLMITDPVGFLDMIQLERNACKIFTDSGGVQKEAYFHKVPCVTLRDQTEWVETVKAGWNVLADAGSEDDILRAASRQPARNKITEYGNGKASEEIARIIKNNI